MINFSKSWSVMSPYVNIFMYQVEALYRLSLIAHSHSLSTILYLLIVLIKGPKYPLKSSDQKPMRPHLRV